MVVLQFAAILARQSALSFPFRPACPLTQWKVIEVEFLNSIVFNLVATAKGCVVCLLAVASSAALESTLIA